MKNIAIALIIAVTCITACQNENTSEVEQKRQELDAKRQELKEKQELVALNQEMKNVEAEIDKTDGKNLARPVVTSIIAKGAIKGEKVIMRGRPSVQSDKLGNFANGEKVNVLSRQIGEMGNEAILKQEIRLYSVNEESKESVYTLPKGKGVIIESLHTNGFYRVSYQHPEMGKLEASIADHLLDCIGNNTWCYIQRSNGETGWVLGKFLVEI